MNNLRKVKRQALADSESAPLPDSATHEVESGANINLLSEAEWRTIHNALAIYHCQKREHARRQSLQRLMDKVRDEYIALYTTDKPQTESP